MNIDLTNQFIRGGFGDLILSIDNIDKNKDLLLISHANRFDICDFVVSLGIHDNPKYHNIFEPLDTNNVLYKEVKKSQYIDWIISTTYSNLLIEKLENITLSKSVLIHPFGSKFALAVANMLNLPNKQIPSSLLDTIISIVYMYGYTPIITGFKSELDSLDVNKTKAVLVEMSNAWTGLALAQECHGFIGSDSSLKTYRVAKKKSAAVLIGDYEDPMRDSIFIEPYVKDKFLKPIKFKNYKDDYHLIVSNIIQYVKFI